MLLIVILNQSSVSNAYLEYYESNRMKPSAYYDRVVDMMEEYVVFTILIRDAAAHLVDENS